MPRNASGTYSLPVASYVAGTTIKSADMNTNLSDIGTALTQSLATTGVTPMTGPIKLAAGSLGAPSLTLASDATTGWYNSAAGEMTYVSAGVATLKVNSSGAQAVGSGVFKDASGGIITGRLIGEVIDYCGTSAPALWLLAFGQAISRTTYSALFGVVGTTYGVGDGATTFNVPDYRSRIGVGKDNMGGVAANRITVAGGNLDATILGNTGDRQNTTLATANLAVHNHGISDPTHTHSHNLVTGTAVLITDNTSVFSSGTPNVAGTFNAALTGVTTTNSGSATAFGITQPMIIVNKIIYVGV